MTLDRERSVMRETDSSTTHSAAVVECTQCGAELSRTSKFCNDCGARQVPASDEQRPIAVLFCDIVGSTGYLKKLGPEEWLKILREFHETLRAVVLRYGGYVAQHLGDGQLVYFGFPHAHDDDARRSVDAGLDAVTSLSGLSGRLLYQGLPELRVRIGIATGRAVMGSLGAGMESLAHGEISHLAARLQSIAAPNTVLVDEATYRLVEGFFQCTPLVGSGPKDFLQVATYVVRGRTGARTRLDISVLAGLTPFTGRTKELGALAVGWQEAGGGARSAVLVSGEPGMGKSRLVSTFAAELEGSKQVLVCRASPHHQNSALYPIVDMVERMLGIVPDEPQDHKLEKLGSWLSGSSALGLDALPSLAPFFSVGQASPGSPPNVSPQKQRQIAFSCLQSWFEFLARQETVLLIVEDVHWADASTLELLGNLLRGQSPCRLLTLLTARPEFQNPWAGVCVDLGLERLLDAQAEQIVASVIRDRVVPRDLLRFVLAKADGVPLFAEEVAKALFEASTLASNDGGSQPVALSTFEIPSTLGGLLTARLDRVGQAKHVAQLAATLGRISVGSALGRELRGCRHPFQPPTHPRRRGARSFRRWP